MIVAPLVLAVAVWKADPPHSSATFTATHLAIAHVSGIIPMKEVTIETADVGTIPARAKAVFDPAGVDTRNDRRDADLRSPHFFDVASFPKMEFTSTNVAAVDAKHFTMTGDLTMHGQTHPVTLNATILGVITDPQGRVHAAYSAKTTIDRTQWGMNYGNPFAGNSIDIDIEVEAIKQ